MKIHHICIQTSDYSASKDFYTEILGFKILKETANFHGRDYNTWLELNGFMIELQTSKKEEFSLYNKESQGIVHFCLYSLDLEKFYNDLIKKGFSNFLSKNGNNVYEVYESKLIKIKAPEGTIIEIRDKWEI